MVMVSNNQSAEGKSLLGLGKYMSVLKYLSIDSAALNHLVLKKSVESYIDSL